MAADRATTRPNLRTGALESSTLGAALRLSSLRLIPGATGRSPVSVGSSAAGGGSVHKEPPDPEREA